MYISRAQMWDICTLCEDVLVVMGVLKSRTVNNWAGGIARISREKKEGPMNLGVM